MRHKPRALKYKRRAMMPSIKKALKEQNNEERYNEEQDNEEQEQDEEKHFNEDKEQKQNNKERHNEKQDHNDMEGINTITRQTSKM